MTAHLLVGIAALVIAVHDGDTVWVEMHPLPQHTVTTKIRLKGINTPEMKGKCEYEKHLAKQARQSVIDALKPYGNEIIINNLSFYKFGGEYAGDVYLPNGALLADELIRRGLGKPYSRNQKRQNWCQ